MSTETLRTSFRSADVDEARQMIGATFYSNFMDVIDGPRTFSAEFEIGQLGALTVGELSCGADVRMRVGELGAYHVNILLGGQMHFRQGGGASTVATAERAGVFQPVGDTVVERWTGDCRILAVKMDREALDQRLEQLIGRPVRTPLALAPELDTTRGPGRGWARLVTTVIEDLREEPGEPVDMASLYALPLVSAPLQEAILNGLLLAVEHPYREELTSPAQKLRPAPVKRAMDAVKEQPEYPFTPAGLAAEARVGVRWLQEAFRRYVGMSPMAYVRDVRLTRVRDELRAAEPGELSVSEVAYRWGFSHLGRFAEQYHARFGELPSQTLRS
ncbi:AraC family transcriptional regulator [Streptomyces sp. NBC_01283]|uniref:AraC family transcriptional regulator n=1 Tax=Streptomyces sp. NBC_01283 TaxID=2903812 RepID=UPI00352DE154|nr:AraC family transcriptional regulator [Streptomyces sp. NBC_01283]